jgi:hypothetical protein
MIPGYTKRQAKHVLHWTSEQISAYEDLRVSVSNCQKLYFMGNPDEWDTYVETDACDYGIGGAVLQIHKVTGERVPIIFVSKALTGAQLNWSVPEKEMYAAYYLFNKLEYMLLDHPFTLRQDHKNLSLIRNKGSGKVLRWDLYMMQFPYRRDYYEGESNIAGDTLSRNLLIPNTKERQENYLTALEEDWTCEETLGSFSELPLSELCSPVSEQDRREAAPSKRRGMYNKLRHNKANPM